MYFYCGLLHIPHVIDVWPIGADLDNSRPVPKCFAFYASRSLGAGSERIDLFGDNKYANSDHY
jgi:hypothetical protein